MIDRKGLTALGFGRETVPPERDPDRRYFESIEEASARPCVYFIEGYGLIKIGMSANLAARFEELRRTIPCPIRLVAAIERRDIGSVRVLEKQLHYRFRYQRRQGEWFDLPVGWLEDLRERRLMLPSPLIACARKTFHLPLTALWGIRQAPAE